MESFNGKLRDELLDREIFYTLQKVDEFFRELQIDREQEAIFRLIVNTLSNGN